MTSFGAEWQPSEQDIRQGQEAYVRYAGGVGILNNPHTEFAQDMLGKDRNVDEHPLCVIVTAEELMHSNLIKLLKVTNPPDIRSANEKLEKRYTQALPHVVSIVDSVFLDNVFLMRLDRINSALLGYRPSPLEQEAIYTQLAHGRRHKLQTARLLDGVGVALELEGLLENRTLSNSRVAHQKRQVSGSQW